MIDTSPRIARCLRVETDAIAFHHDDDLASVRHCGDVNGVRARVLEYMGEYLLQHTQDS